MIDSGPLAGLKESQTKAVNLAIKEINEAGDAAGRKFEADFVSRSAGGLAPDVAPQVTNRPPRRKDFRESAQLAAPTLSITISTPPALISRIDLATLSLA